MGRIGGLPPRLRDARARESAVRRRGDRHPIALPSLHEVIDFSTGTFGYIAFAFTVAVSAAALLLARKAKRAEKEGAPISPEKEDRDTPVFVPPELPEESGASAPTLPVPERGKKRRAGEDKGGGDA